MGLFDSLFGKKACNVCGGDFGSQKVHKLKDGKCCTPCAQKMSMWSGPRSQITVAQARQQIAWREAHRSDAKDFYPTKIYGFNSWIMVDEKTKHFTATRDLNIHKSTVDIIAFSQILNCQTMIKEQKTEVLQEVWATDKHNDSVCRKERYWPRRYHYGYNFILQLKVDHPFIREMEISVSSGFVNVLTGEDQEPEGRTQPPTMEQRMADPYYSRFDTELQELKSLLLDSASPEKQDKLPREKLIFDPMITVFKNACQDVKMAEQIGHPGMSANAVWARTQAVMALQDAAKTAKASAAKAGVADIIAEYTDG